MRTLKFRGKCTAGIGEGKWIYGLIARIDGLFSILVSSSSEDGECHYTVDEDTIGQFIGLYDADGKEIYEGDIIMNIRYQNLVKVVFYENATASFRAVEIEHFKRSNRVGFSSCIEEDVFCVYKVIGNIKDNPELLKQKY